MIHGQRIGALRQKGRTSARDSCETSKDGTCISPSQASRFERVDSRPRVERTKRKRSESIQRPETAQKVSSWNSNRHWYHRHGYLEVVSLMHPGDAKYLYRNISVINKNAKSD